MQASESFNVPRRTLDVEDYIDILRRHKGWIFGPLPVNPSRKCGGCISVAR